MARVLVPLAQGCEELEAVTIIDLLRRAKIEVVTASLTDGPVVASRGVKLIPDSSLDEAAALPFDMIVLPGGLPGADHLRDDSRVQDLLKRAAAAGKFTAAICAAPKALARAGLLRGKRATSYPGSLSESELDGIDYCDDPVVRDGYVVTSRGPGTAMDFALALIELLADNATRQQVEAGLQRPTS